MTAPRSPLAAALAVVLLISPIEAAAPGTRTFFMGLTPAEYDATPSAVQDTYAFIGRHADLIAHHFVKGVPWPEAHDQRRYPAAVERDLQFRQLKRQLGQRVFLAVSPITVAARGLGGYWGARGDMPRPGSWGSKDFDDPEVITAYSNFCTTMILRFHPDFMAYGVEVNGLVRDAPAEWPKFVKFARLVYSGLKVEHPGLPIFVTLQLDYFWADELRQRKAIREILPYTDYLAVSTYPYVNRYADPRSIPRDYFARFAALAPSKPFAVAETGFAAREVRALGTTIPGRPDWQEAYLRFLLAESDRLRARFVVWFVPRDYDLLVDRLKAMRVAPATIELYELWKSNGLLDAKGNPRMALDTWMAWLNRPRAAVGR